MSVEEPTRRSLPEQVARAIYEQRATRRSCGWDDTLDVIRDEYLAMAVVSLGATQLWLLDAMVVFQRRPQVAAAIQMCAGIIRRTLPAETK